MREHRDSAPYETDTTDVIIVGTGFSGLGLATALKRSGASDFVVLERAADVGGTWRDNTYPGAACDIQSHLYSYSFRPNPDWSRVYAGQAEILAYLRATAAEEGLYPHIRFGAEVTSAQWRDHSQLWEVVTQHGVYRARSLVLATGHLSDPKLPEIDGIDRFAGPLFHSARWDHSVSWAGKNVGVLGTGASAIQIVPELAESAGHVTVFQRSAPYVIPRNDRMYTDAEKGMFRRLPDTARRCATTCSGTTKHGFPSGAAFRVSSNRSKPKRCSTSATRFRTPHCWRS